MKITKKKKRKNDDRYITIEESKIMACKVVKNIEKTIIMRMCESIYVALIDTLHAPPYMWSPEKIMRYRPTGVFRAKGFQLPRGC